MRRPHGRGAHGDWHARWHGRWHERWNAAAIFAHYVRASLHRRIFFLIGASLLVNGLIVGLLGHAVGIDDASHASHRGRGYALLALFVLMLWGVSGKIAKRLTRPFVELSRVAQEIGRGNLGARFTMGPRGRSGEAFLIGVSINDMAARIEKQLKDQRELLAAVSHEVRTPLARIRMLVELGRSRAADGGFLVDAKTLDDVDREVMEIDALVGELLASSRLDFAVASRTELEAGDVARRALERQTLPREALDLGGLDQPPLLFQADATLIQRALANLLHNAVVHGGGVDRLGVAATAGAVRFEVRDRGPGLGPGEETKIFDPFYRGAAGDKDARGAAANGAHPALGLGLALVHRIAKAHGGHAFARNRADGPGACIGFEIPRIASATEARELTSA